jgi:hypothetical protein
LYSNILDLDNKYVNSAIYLQHIYL